MTSSEWAAWVQAVGSIAAIFGATGIAIWQSGRQHKNSLELVRTEHRLARTEVARALLSLSTNGRRLLERYATQLPDRDSVHDVAEGRVHLDLNELKVVEGAVHSIPLYTLPHRLVSITMMVSSTIRQFRENIELALQDHRKMDAAAFDTFFVTLSEMQKSLELTCDDIQAEVTKSENEA